KRFFGLQPESLGSILSVDNYDKFFFMVNNVLSDRTFLNFGYLFNDTRKINVRGAAPGEGLPSSYRNNPVRDQTVYANLVHVFSPALTADTKLQYGRRNFFLEPSLLEPALNVSNLFFSGGYVGSVRSYREQRVQLAENITYTRGNHTLKFGGEAQPVWTNAQVPLFSPGFGVFCPDSLFGTPNIFGCGDFSALGPTALVFLFLQPRELFGTQIQQRTLPFSTGLYTGVDGPALDASTRFSYVHKLYGLYFQDQWRVRPNFTLTLGLRYDVDVLPSGPDTKTIGNFHPTDYNNVQPRVAFAYSFRGGKDVLRGGFGIFNSPFVYSDILVSWIGASEFTYMNTVTPPLIPEFANPTRDLIGFGASGAVGIPPIQPLGFPSGAAFLNFTTTGTYPAPGNPLAPLLQFPLGYAKKDFPLPYAEQASLELEHQLGRDWFLSAGYQFLHAIKLPVYSSVNALPDGTPTNCPFLPLDPNFPADKVHFCPADPNFGFVLYVAPTGFSIYHAGTLSLRKNFANHYSILTNYTYSKSIDIETTINLPNTPENYLRPDLDRSVGDNDIRHRLVVAVLGESPKQWPVFLRDFRASVLLNAQSARRSSINVGFDTNNDLFPFSDRVGTIGRNTYKGDPYYNVDMRIQRAFPIRERLRAEFSAEFFNLFNIVNVQDVNHVYGAADFIFGPTPQEFGDGLTTPANFGTPKFVAPARQIQFSFRLNF
ncbi:MAG: TonB-dependent receptor domain-containing protein, partial [Terriglobales bacterium]